MFGSRNAQIFATCQYLQASVCFLSKIHNIFFAKSIEKSGKIGYTIIWYKNEFIYGGLYKNGINTQQKCKI